MYFGKFPQTFYSKLSRNGSPTLAVDILRKVSFFDAIKDETKMAGKYFIPDGETPEVVADKIYGDSSFHWVLLLANQVINPLYDWPLDTVSLERYIDEKYPGYTMYLTEEGNTGSPTPLNYKEGDTVFLTDGTVDFDGRYDYGGDQRARVWRWNKTDNALTINFEFPSAVNFSEGDIVALINNDESISIARIKRIEQSRYAAHHFENTDGVVLGSLVNYLGIPLGETASGTPLAVPYWDTMIGKYMGMSGSADNSFVVTNQDYEYIVNDAKREIDIINPAFVTKIAEEFATLIEE
jgi:hypothetical protein